VLCVLAFAATGAAVYRLGAKQAHRADRYMAAATIHHRLGPSAAPRACSSEPLSVPYAVGVEAEILSQQSLQRALRKLGLRADNAASSGLLTGPNQTIEQARQSLRVSSTKTSQPAELEISISCTDEDPGRVVRLVNALAEGYAEEHRAKREATGQFV